MKKQAIVAALVAAAVFAVAGAFFSMIYAPEREGAVPRQIQVGAVSTAAFAPPDPQKAPPPLGEEVVQGYWVLMQTQDYAPQHVGGGNTLSCRNCHFEAGRSRESISLVGVAGKYPRVEAGPQGGAEVTTLARRVADCFRANLGGEPPAEDSPLMRSVLYYLQWISGGTPIYGEVEWLGLRPLDAPQRPDAGRGRQVYASVCSKCHGSDGQGSIGPALWGAGSFTTASQFADVRKLGSFVHQAMPYRKPNLLPQAAADVAAFVLTRSRPQPGAPPPAATAAEAPLPEGNLPIPAALPEDASGSGAREKMTEISRKLQGMQAGERTAGKGATPQAAQPPAAPPSKTLEEKLGGLGRPLEKMPKKTAEEANIPLRTKKGQRAGIPVIAEPPPPPPAPPPGKAGR